MEKCREGNGGQKDFQKTEGEGPGFLCGASQYIWLGGPELCPNYININYKYVRTNG